jgi:hypothetical protein
VIEEIRQLIVELTSRASKTSESAIEEVRLMMQELRRDFTSLQSRVDALPGGNEGLQPSGIPEVVEGEKKEWRQEMGELAAHVNTALAEVRAQTSVFADQLAVLGNTPAVQRLAEPGQLEGIVKNLLKPEQLFGALDAERVGRMQDINNERDARISDIQALADDFNQVRSSIQALADELARERAARETCHGELSLALEGAQRAVQHCSSLEQRVVNQAPAAPAEQNQELEVRFQQHLQDFARQHQLELQSLRQDLNKASCTGEVDTQVQQHLQAFEQQFKEQHQAEFGLLRQDLEQASNVKDLDSRVLQHLHDFKDHHQSELLSIRKSLEQACDVDARVEQHLQGVRQQHQSDLQLLREDLHRKHEDFHATVQQISKSIAGPMRLRHDTFARSISCGPDFQYPKVNKSPVNFEPLSELAGGHQVVGAETHAVISQPEAAGADTCTETSQLQVTEADTHAVISDSHIAGVDTRSVTSERQVTETESAVSEHQDTGADAHAVNSEHQVTETGSVISGRQVSGPDEQDATDKPKAAGSWWRRLSSAQRLSGADASKTSEAQATPLQVTILGAKGLRVADWSSGEGKSDPYCICELQGKPSATKIQTDVVYHDLDPTWNHEATLTDHVMGDSLVFKVYDVDYVCLGSLVLPSEKFHPDGFEGELPLDEAGEGVAAALRLKIQPAAVEAASNDWESEY